MPKGRSFLHWMVPSPEGRATRPVLLHLFEAARCDGESIELIRAMDVDLL